MGVIYYFIQKVILNMTDQFYQYSKQDVGAKINKNEKKARKILNKVGLVGCSSVNRVTIKKSKDILFVFQIPDVYKIPDSDTYIIYGEARIEDVNTPNHADAVRKLNQLNQKKEKINSEPEAEKEVEEEIDISGLDPNDIQMVIDQSGCSKLKAIEALKEADGDIVNAIMDMTMKR